MPVLRFVGSIRPSREGLLLLPDPAYDALVDTALADVKTRTAKKREGDPSYRTEFAVSVEWHYRKRSLDQNALMWTLIGAMADIVSAGGGRKTSHELYEDWLDTWAPRVEIVIDRSIEYPVRGLLHHVYERVELPGGNLRLRAVVGSSQWDVPTMTRAIQHWFDELASLGVPNDVGANVAAWWREWRLDLSRRGVDLADVNAVVSLDNYRSLHLLCECCGAYIGTGGGEIAHISARGMGGGTRYDDRVGNLLHLCIDCHRLGRDAQHQKGWGAIINRAPWLKTKIKRALSEPEGDT